MLLKENYLQEIEMRQCGIYDDDISVSCDIRHLQQLPDILIDLVDYHVSA